MVSTIGTSLGGNKDRSLPNSDLASNGTKLATGIRSLSAYLQDSFDVSSVVSISMIKSDATQEK